MADTPTAWRIDHPKAVDVTNTKSWERFGDPMFNAFTESALRDDRDVRLAAALADGCAR